VRLRVATYNVHGLRRPVAVARVIASLEADAVLVQEYASKVLLLPVARGAGMRAVAPQRRGRPFQRNAELVRGDIRVVRAWPVELPSTPPRESRGATLAELETGPARFVVASVHLGLEEHERAEHARLLVDEVVRTGLPCIVGGDLNEGPDGAAARAMAERLVDASPDGGPTFPAANPSARIDVLFVGAGARVVSSVVIDGGRAHAASDHLPAAAVIDVEP